MIPMKEMPKWDEGEEFANMLTHLVGTLLSFIGVLLMIIEDLKNHDPYKFAGCIVYGVSMITLYLISTLYHGFESENIKKVFRYGDHISIYLLIAGSYTPFTLTCLRNDGGWIIFGIIWGIAAIGIFLKIMYFDGFGKLSLVFYIVMGWTVIFSINTVISSIKPIGVYWLFAGGIYYTFGTFFFSRDENIPFAHSIWHLFVLAGSICHFICVFFYI